MNEQQLKTAISEVLVEHFADELDMTVGEYGYTYDSEKHEALLNRVMRIVLKERQEYGNQRELEGRINEVHNFGNWNSDRGIAELWEPIELRLKELKSQQVKEGES